MFVRFDVLMAPLPQVTLFKSHTFDPKQWQPREGKELHTNTDSIIMMSRNNLIVIRNMMLMFMASTNGTTYSQPVKFTPGSMKT